MICAKYRLGSLLGEGGMGTVWQARNTVLDVDVAIKLIRHGVAPGDASERLLQEARAAARLEHPSIIRIFDFGATEEGAPFITMELLRGESLAHLLDRRGRLSATNAVRTVLPVASAVCAAHAKGIIHRDLKPDNVILTENDAGTVVPKVLDFGIAKVRVEGTAGRSITQGGAILGSPDYMSPEQARGRAEVDEKSDVWSLAVMLYECLVGQRPFNGDNYNALITSIIEDSPTPTPEFAAGDDGLWQIVQAALSKDPSLRPTMRAFGEQLATWAFDAGAEADLSGVSLVHWIAPSSPGPFAEIAPPSGRGTLRRREVDTRASLVEMEVNRASATGSATPTATPTHGEGTTLPSRARRGLAVAPLLLLALGGVTLVAWVSLRGAGTPVVREDAGSGARAEAPAVTSPPAPEVLPAAPAPPPPADSGAAPSAQASAPRPRVTRPAPQPAKKADPTLRIPAAPNF